MKTRVKFISNSLKRGEIKCMVEIFGPRCREWCPKWRNAIEGAREGGALKLVESAA